MVFWITFVIYTITTAFYALMCSGEQQPWADPVSEDDSQASSQRRSESIDTRYSSEQPLTTNNSAQSKSNSRQASVSPQNSQSK